MCNGDEIHAKCVASVLPNGTKIRTTRVIDGRTIEIICEHSSFDRVEDGKIPELTPQFSTIGELIA
jgi:hypothetical protein